MTRSLGTLPPAIFAKVGNKSIWWTMSLLTDPAAILPGQRMANGTRKPPSSGVRMPPRHWPVDPRPAVSTVVGFPLQNKRLGPLERSQGCMKPTSYFVISTCEGPRYGSLP